MPPLADCPLVSITNGWDRGQENDNGLPGGRGTNLRPVVPPYLKRRLHVQFSPANLPNVPKFYGGRYLSRVKIGVLASFGVVDFCRTNSLRLA